MIKKSDPPDSQHERFEQARTATLAQLHDICCAPPAMHRDDHWIVTLSGHT